MGVSPLWFPAEKHGRDAHATRYSKDPISFPSYCFALIERGVHMIIVNRINRFYAPGLFVGSYCQMSWMAPETQAAMFFTPSTN